MDVSECVDCTLQSDGCRNAGPAVIAHPHILEKEASQCCQCVPQWVEVVRWQPSFSHAVKVAEQSRPSSSVKHVFTFFPLCVYYVQPGNVLLFYISSLKNELSLCVDKGSRSFKWQASSFACLVFGRNPATVYETQFPICSDRISPPDAKVAD